MGKMTTAADESREKVSGAHLTASRVYVRRGYKIDRGDSIGVRPAYTLMDSTIAAAPGMLVAVIGPNGAGKSTFLRAICGERPAAGMIQLNHINIYDEPESVLADVGYVPTDSVLNDNLSVVQSLLYLSLIRNPDLSDGLDKLRERITGLLKKFGIDSVSDRPIRTLSSGERKKANICAELLSNPSLLLLDEPTSNLDPNAELELMQRLRSLADGGRTVLIVTHTLNHLGLCHKVFFVENGQVHSRSGLAAAETRAALFSTADVKQSSSALKLTTSHRANADHVSSEMTEWAAVFEAFRTVPSVIQQRRNTAWHADLVEVANPRPGNANGGSTVAGILKSLPFLLMLNSQVQLNQPLRLVLTVSAGLTGLVLLTVLSPNAFLKPDSPAEFSGQSFVVRMAIFALSLLATILGLIPAASEITNDFRFIRQERLKGLSISAYVIAKYVTLCALVAIVVPPIVMASFGNPVSRDVCLVLGLAFIVFAVAQSLLIYWLIERTTGAGASDRTGWILGRLPLAVASLPFFISPLLPGFTGTKQLVAASVAEPLVGGLAASNAELLVLLTLSLGIAAAISVGLLVSALSDRIVVTLGVLAIVIVVTVLYALPSSDPATKALSILSPTRWISDGVAASTSLHCWIPNTGLGFREGEFNSVGSLLGAWGSLVILSLGCVGMTIAVLRLKDPWGTPKYFALLVVRNKKVLLVLLAACVSLLGWTAFSRALSSRMLNLTVENPGNGHRSFAHATASSQIQLLEILAMRIGESFCREQKIIALAPEPPAVVAENQPVVPARVGTPPFAVAIPSVTRGADVVTRSLAATPTPTPAPSVGLPKLFELIPSASTITDTRLLFQPNGSAQTEIAIPALSRVTPTGRTVDSAWIRVYFDGRFGWIRADALDLAAQSVNRVEAPPTCASPVAVIRKFGSPWVSSFSGRVVAVLDLYRLGSNINVPTKSLTVLVNDKSAGAIEGLGGRGELLQHSAGVVLVVKTGDRVSLTFGDASDAVTVFGVLYAVPDTCRWG